jgi:hypothetical protein
MGRSSVGKNTEKKTMEMKGLERSKEGRSRSLWRIKLGEEG